MLLCDIAPCSVVDVCMYVCMYVCIFWSDDRGSRFLENGCYLSVCLLTPCHCPEHSNIYVLRRQNLKSHNTIWRAAVTFCCLMCVLYAGGFNSINRIENISSDMVNLMYEVFVGLLLYYSVRINVGKNKNTKVIFCSFVRSRKFCE
jgi:hypothetical protein